MQNPPFPHYWVLGFPHYQINLSIFNVMLDRSFLISESRKHHVTDAELAALLLAIDGHSSQEIADKLKISPAAARQRLSEVYQKFRIEGKGPVKLKNLIQVLMKRYQGLQGAGSAPSFPEARVDESQATVAYYDWGQIPEPVAFYGRDQEVATLQHWILEDHHKLTGITGLPGIGKTALAAQLCTQLQDDFELIIWRSLHSAPPPQELLVSLLQTLLEQSQTKDIAQEQSWSHSVAALLSKLSNGASIPEAFQTALSQLLEFLSEHHCLIVLDGFESVLRDNDLYKRYKEGYTDYSTLLKTIARVPHQSNIILTSRDQLRELTALQQENVAQSLQLSDLSMDAAQELLKQRGLVGGKQSWQQLITKYRGNPLHLKLVSTTIEGLFNSQITQFIKIDTTLVSPEYRKILDEVFQHLSDIEKKVIRQLANQDKPVTFQQIQANLDNNVISSDLIEVLQSLRQNALLEPDFVQGQGTLRFTLQPVIRKYVLQYAQEAVMV